MKNFKNASKVATTNEELALAYIYIGDTYFEQGEYDIAIEKYSSAIKVGNDELVARALLSRGNAQIKTGEWENAHADFKAARQTVPEFCQAYLNEGDVYFELGNTEEAFMCYYMAIQNVADAQKSSAYLHRSMKFTAIGVRDKATADILAAGGIAEQKFFGLTRNKFADLRKNLELKLFENAEDIGKELILICNQSIKKYQGDKMGIFYCSNDDESYFNIQRTKMKTFEAIGDGYETNNMDEQALYNYCQAEKILSKFSQDVFGNTDDCFQILIKKGNILSKMGRPEQAVQTFKSASKFVQIDIQKIECLKQIGDCHLQMNQIDLAIDEYTTAIKIAEDNMAREVQKIIDGKKFHGIVEENEKQKRITSFTNTIEKDSIIAGRKAILLAKRGSAYWRNGQFEQGQKDFSKLRKFGMFGSTMVQCFEIYAQSFKFEGDKIFKDGQNSEAAFEMYQKAIDVAPEIRKCGFILHNAQQRAEVGQINQAMQQCEYAQKFAKTDYEKNAVEVEQLRLEGDQMFENQQFESAFKCYENSVRKASDDQKSRLRTHSAMQKFKARQFEKGFNDCDDAIGLAQTYKDMASAYAEMSWGYYQNQDILQAKQNAIYATEFEENGRTRKLLDVIKLHETVDKANKKIIKLVDSSFDRAEEAPWVDIHREIIGIKFDNGQKTAKIPKIVMTSKLNYTIQ